MEFIETLIELGEILFCPYATHTKCNGHCLCNHPEYLGAKDPLHLVRLINQVID